MSTPLEDGEALLYGAGFSDQIGDTISYKAVGATTYATLTAFVDFADQLRSYDGSQVIDQDMTVELSKTLAPVKPSDGCRIQTAKRPGKTYKPVNVATDRSGCNWIFELKAVNV